MKLSVVTTLYYSAPYILEFHDRIKASAEKITNDYEIIFVNDGSPDRSLEQAVMLHNTHDRVAVIDLSRNFGHHKAIMTGLSQARGELVFLIDSDLEEPPEGLQQFWEKMHSNDGFDVVYGVQADRKGGWFERTAGSIFYSVLAFFSEVEVGRNIVVMRLMTRRFVDNLLKFKEREFVFAGITRLAGFNQIPLIINKVHKGTTTYSFRRRFLMAINFIVSLSSRPLEFIFYLGTTISLLSFVFIIKLILNKLIYRQILLGWTSILVSVWFLGGMIILSIGVVGIYISKIFIEVKQRPYSIIKKIYQAERRVTAIST